MAGRSKRADLLQLNGQGGVAVGLGDPTEVEGFVKTQSAVQNPVLTPNTGDIFSRDLSRAFLQIPNS